MLSRATRGGKTSVTPHAHLHRSGGQHEEREEQQEGTVKIADLGPLLRVKSSACDTDEDDDARHDQRGKDDDVEVRDEVICPFKKRSSAHSSRSLAISLTHALHSHSTIHAIGMMRSSERSSTERRRSNVANGLRREVII